MIRYDYIYTESGGSMESNTFKSVMFGGFDRQDVISYIEKTSQETTAAIEALQQENKALRTEQTAAQSQLEALRQEAESCRLECARLKEELETQSAARDALKNELDALRPERDALLAQVQELKPQADSYQKAKEHIGNIECEARKRADELEAATNERLNQLLQQCKQQYWALTSTFETASAHVTGEMRKIEVSISQLPVSFDKLGADLKALEETLNG